MKHDVFISHAGADKDEYIRPIAAALEQKNIAIWLDELEIRWGDSIALKINEGLKTSRFALICLSEAFCERPWPETELSSVLSMQNSDGVKRVLPLILNEREKVLEQYPILSGSSYRTYDGTPATIATELNKLLHCPSSSGSYELIIEAVHRGIVERLIVPERASIKWIVRELQQKLGLNDVADTGGFTMFPIRWILVHNEVESEWLKIPRHKKQRIKAVVRSHERGTQIATEDHLCLKDLGATHRSVFHIYAIEDDRWPSDP